MEENFDIHNHHDFQDAERDFENTLRPLTFTGFKGQSKIVENLKIGKEKIKLEMSELKEYDLKKNIELEKKLKAINILIKKSKSLVSKS